ncbi:hypothetical protein [Actinocrispum sp. NPDC049592]|uniref:VMAP-C domain-containing protein n=1 Tax=Actinocrispum sp. NPDC049592 TaxID=3154835 RepID=UPI00341B7F07
MSSGDRPLSVRELEMLCTAFMALPGIRDPHARELYLEVLDAEAGPRLSFARYPDLRHDIWSILTTCMLNGVIRKLTEIVRQFHQGSRAMYELDALVEALFPEDFLRQAEREELVALLAGIDRRQLLEAFRWAGPWSWQTMVVDVADPADLIRRLEGCIGGLDRPPPLLMFVDYLAHQLDPHREAEHHRWIDKIGGRKNVPVGQLRALCSARPQLETVHQYYLVLQLVPDGVDPDRYLTSAWLQRHGSIEEPLYRNDDALRLEEVRDLLPHLLGAAHAGAGDNAELMLEFILPRRLIDLPIDQWVIDEVLPHALGVDYVVVIRSLDRMRRRKSHRAWQVKSRWLAGIRHLGTPPESVMWLSTPGARAPKALYSALLSEDSTVTLAMNFPPESSADLRPDELTAALYAGIPVIVWVRDETFGSVFEKVLRKLLAAHGLGELPTALLRLRRQSDEEQTLGSHITLVYDDYSRIPESFTRSTRLQAPQTQ